MNVIAQLCLRGEDPHSPQARRRCGTISGGMGIVLNLLLSISKLLAGLLTASVAMTADGLNNLSDAATSVVTLIGFRLAGQEADAEHPFGHGRIEYVAGLIVSLAVLLMLSGLVILVFIVIITVSISALLVFILAVFAITVAIALLILLVLVIISVTLLTLRVWILVRVVVIVLIVAVTFSALRGIQPYMVIHVK